MFAFLSNRDLVCVTGKDRFRFLQGLITNDLNLLRSDGLLYSCLLTPQGKFLYDFFIFDYQNAYYIDIASHWTGDFLTKINLYKLRQQVVFNKCPDATIYAADDALLRIENTLDFLDPRHKCLGKRFYRLLQGPLQTQDSFETYNLFRSQLGVPDGSYDIPVEKGVILDYGLHKLHAISFDKGCYMGQELMARVYHRGLSRKYCASIFIEETLSSTEMPLMKDGKEVGLITSSCGPFGIALLRTERGEIRVGDRLMCGQTTVVVQPSVLDDSDGQTG